eukprot:CAMPEP_0174892542 /NCGR_PEP_ID=MMETSP0167-20121228/7476_1 /TAXON_ID=38298 /ORGANISM="Rhodella maculata, Strain CCMP736" /LENGTH=71 /DNA_ID=CAMNT_0016131063 /DNA_START=363 /DNA_END=575 /DNA_ORIENTATION=-
MARAAPGPKHPARSCALPSSCRSERFNGSPPAKPRPSNQRAHAERNRGPRVIPRAHLPVHIHPPPLLHLER